MNEAGDRAAVRPCVAALAAKQEELRRALAGRSLLVLLAYPDGHDLRLMLTRSGLVSVLPPDEPFDAQVEIGGTAEDIRSFLVGRTSLGDAILRGVVAIRIPEDEAASYEELRALVAAVAEANC